MNYNLQMFQTNLSNGDNGSGDHDDWGAIDSSGLADFSSWDTSQIGYGSSLSIDEGLTIQQAKDAIKKKTLGQLKKNGKIYNFRDNSVQDLKTGIKHRLQ